MTPPPEPTDASPRRGAVRRRAAGVPVVVWVGFAAFVGLGLPEATLGVTWPSIRTEMDRPLSSLGILLGALTAGYLPTSAVSGRIVARLGAGRMLATASGIYVLAMATYVLAPTFEVLVVASLLGGVAAGLIDPGLNAHFALHHGARAMNLLHTSFGVGATLGPFLATISVSQAGQWRLPYVMYLVVQAALLVAFVLTRDRWSIRADADDHRSVERPTAAAGLVDRILVGLSLAVFFVYTGFEVGAGVLAFTLLSESRGLSDASAGLWATAFWAGLTVGRGALGVLGARLGPERTLRAGALGAIASTLLIWADPGGAGAVGFPVLGLCLSGIFPSLVLLTPRRVGPARTADVVGIQFSLAGIGASALPAAIGVLAEGHLERIGPALLALAVTVVVLDLLIGRLAGTPADLR